MIKPGKLSAGDTVALVSLSCGMAGEEAFSHRVRLGKARLEAEFGLGVVIMPNAMRGIEYLAQTPKARADDLMAAFADPGIKAVITMIGGDDTIRLLPHIDFELLRQNPKVFMGYSDTTVNHFMMYKAGLGSFYGPCVLADFAENGAMHAYTKEAIRQTLFERHATLPILSSPQWTSEFLDWGNPDNNAIPRRMLPETRGYELLQGTGTARGRLLGGCADVFPMMIGSEIWPCKEAWKNTLLFLETSENYLAPGQLKYLLRGLVAQGVVANINGLLFGKPKNEKYYNEYKEVLLQVIGGEAGRPDLPILYNLNFGHTAPLCILPYGVTAEISCAQKALRLLEAPVC